MADPPCRILNLVNDYVIFKVTQIKCNYQMQTNHQIRNQPNRHKYMTIWTNKNLKHKFIKWIQLYITISTSKTFKTLTSISNGVDLQCFDIKKILIVSCWKKNRVKISQLFVSVFNEEKATQFNIGHKVNLFI